MSFKKHEDKINNVVYYNFTNEGVDNLFYIKREIKNHDEINYIENTIFWGIIKDNKFSMKSESGNLNLYNLRSVLFEILDDFETNFVSKRLLETYNITFSQAEEAHETKCNFTYKSLCIKYGQENVILDISHTVTVFLNKDSFSESSEEITQSLKRI